MRPQSMSPEPLMTLVTACFAAAILLVKPSSVLAAGGQVLLDE